MNENQVVVDADAGTARVGGPLDIYHAAALKDALLRLVRERAPLALDLSQVSEFDSAGFQLLALLRRECAAHGVALTIAPASRPVHALLDTYRCGDWAAARD